MVAVTPVFLVENEKENVVKEVTAEGITISTNNKETNIITVDKYDSSGDTLLTSMTIDLNNIDTEEVSSPYAFNSESQKTFMNREYITYFGDPNRWELRSKDKRKSVKESSKNKADLRSFRSAVERVNSGEFAVIAAVGVGGSVTILTALLTGGLGAGLAAAGSGTAISAAVIATNSACNDADFYYNEAK